MRFTATLLSPGWDLVWFGLKQVLCVLLQPLWVHRCSRSTLSRRPFPCSYVLSPAFTFFFLLPLPQWFLSLGNKGAVLYVSHLGLRVLQFLTLCTLVRRESPNQYPSKQKLFRLGLRYALICGYNSKSLKSVKYCNCFCHRTCDLSSQRLLG